MIIEDKIPVTCPAYNKKVLLKVGYNKMKAPPKDVGFTYKYIGFSCDVTRSGKYCPHTECPLVELMDLRNCIYQ